MLISSWNVNSVRARIENIKSYLLKYKPDILMMQEIKTEDVIFRMMIFHQWTMKVMYLVKKVIICLLYTSPSPRDVEESRMPSSA